MEKIPRLDFFYFSRHVQRELGGASYVDFWSLKTSSVRVFHLVVMSFKRRGHFAKETCPNFVGKWLCSLDLLNCHDARWNALLNLCWLMCARVSVCEYVSTQIHANVWSTLCERSVVVSNVSNQACCCSGNCCKPLNSLTNLLRRIIFKRLVHHD